MAVQQAEAQRASARGWAASRDIFTSGRPHVILLRPLTTNRATHQVGSCLLGSHTPGTRPGGAAWFWVCCLISFLLL